MGYTGSYFETANFFDGSDKWLMDGNPDSLPPSVDAYLYQGVVDLHATADWIMKMEHHGDTRGVIFGMGPWNEALLNDNDKEF